jgi:hypothetical protein
VLGSWQVAMPLQTPVEQLAADVHEDPSVDELHTPTSMHEPVGAGVDTYIALLVQFPLQFSFHVSTISDAFAALLSTDA